VIAPGRRLGSRTKVALTERDLVLAMRQTAEKLRTPERGDLGYTDAQYSAAGVWMLSRRTLLALGWTNEQLDEAGGAIKRRR
jgi:hypothetical protein